MRRLGAILIFLFVGVAASAGVRDYSLKILAKYPHDVSAYTQGLFFHNGVLYETTGQYGESSIRIVDLESGKVTRKLDISSKYFGEGSCVVDGSMYVLTWKNRVAFVYDADGLKWKKNLSYQREGWGLAAIPEAERKNFGNAVMVSSDGSSSLYFLDRNLSTLKTVTVRLNDRPVRLLNELEWVDGKIWANVYTTDMIIIIDPLTGSVTGKIDCSGLIPQNRRTPSMDVLNGIAVRTSDDGADELFLTGKYWPWIFKVSVSEL